MKLHRTSAIRRNRKSGINLSLKMVSGSSKTSPLNKTISRGSGDWINNLPSSTLKLKLTPEQFRIASSLRLGDNISSPYTCEFGAQADVKGIHVLPCAKSCSHHRRHGLGSEAIKRAFCLSEIQSSLEPVGLSLDDRKRPDGFTLSPWKNALCLIWDFTCFNSLAMSNVARGTFPGPTMADKVE